MEKSDIKGLERRHVVAEGVVYIGKEATNIDDQALDVKKPQEFVNEQEVKERILNLSYKEGEGCGRRRLIRRMVPYPPRGRDAMKVLVIMGSPRNGNTCHAVQRIEALMRSRIAPGEELEFTYLMLRDAGLSECRGCFTCFTKGEEHCPLKDRAPEIERQMHEADGMIFASPVYGMNVTGLFKTFVDRFAYIFHRPRFFDKTALLVTTTGMLGHKDAP